MFDGWYDNKSEFGSFKNVLNYTSLKENVSETIQSEH